MRSVGWLVVLGLVNGCAEGANQTPEVGGPPEGAELARSALAREADLTLSAADAATFGADNRALALTLYQQLARERTGNLFLSPYSIQTALGMTFAGAKGETASEIATALHYTLEQPRLHEAFNATDQALARRKNELAATGSNEPMRGDGFQLNLVNQAWGRKGYRFLDTYLDLLALHYGAGLFLLDFGRPEAARAIINGWVEEQTRTRIKDLLPQGSIGPDTALVLTNAIYFKASWLEKFDVKQTAPAPFHADDGEREVAMMRSQLDARYAQLVGYQMIELPYVSRNVAMLVVLPPAGPLLTALQRLDTALFDQLREKLARHLVTLQLPKWSFESARQLKEPLRALGMVKAFEPGSADLSGMDGQPGQLYIDEVYHKAFVAVDEQGTEAAAATAVVIREVSAPPHVELRVDRPFMFFLFDQPTGQILFLGHVTDPS